MPRKLIKIAAIFTIVLWALPSTVSASRAGLVVKHSSGETKSRCVTFDGEMISGWQLLERSGFNPIAKNGFIVEIDGEKTADNQQMSDNDAFWSYWQFVDSWKFFNMGANYTKVKNGDIQGWELSTGQNSLPQVSFDKICSDEAVKQNESVAPSTTGTQTIVPTTKPSVTSVAKEKANLDPSVVQPVEKTKSPDVVPKILGVSDQRQNNILEFNLKNILIVFSIFILSGLIFVFAKIRLNKFLARRKS